MLSNRLEAGGLLAVRLERLKEKAVVVAIPRGGVEVGYAIAKHLGCSLDIVISKKIPYPGQPELAVGAVCNDMVSIDPELEKSVGSRYLDAEIKRLSSAVQKRYYGLAGRKKFTDLKGRIVILTDDGVATGHTFLAAVDFIRENNPENIVAAIPVGASESLEEIRKKVDELVVLERPPYFMAVGAFYRDFEQLDDAAVRNYIKMAKEWVVK